MKTQFRHTTFADVALTEEGTFKSFDGTRIWYKATGRGTPIILCNGLGCSIFYYKYLEPFLRQHHRVILWDYRGHGKSAPPNNADHHGLQALISDLKKLMDHLKVPEAILVGHSMGSQLVFEFVKKYPERVKAIVSICGFFGKPLDHFYNLPFAKTVMETLFSLGRLFPKLSNQVSSLVFKNPLWFQFGGLLKMMQPLLVDKTVLEKYIDHIIAMDPVLFSDLVTSMQEHDAEAYLPQIECPVMVIAGEDDTFTPAWISKKMHHLIKKSELLVVHKGSHIALIEQPELINLRIEKFITNTVYRSRKKNAPNGLLSRSTKLQKGLLKTLTAQKKGRVYNRPSLQLINNQRRTAS